MRAACLNRCQYKKNQMFTSEFAGKIPVLLQMIIFNNFPQILINVISVFECRHALMT